MAVTQKWSTFERGDTRGLIECEVDDAADANDARAKVAAATGFQKGATFPLDHSLKMLENGTVIGNLGLRTVRCEFLKPDFGEPGGGDDNDPLLQPPIIRWGRSVLLEPTDLARRVDDNAAWVKMRNINGDGFSPRSNKAILSRTVSITKNLRSYPLDLDIEFEDAVNSEQIVMVANDGGGNYTFDQGRVQVQSIDAAEFPANQRYVPVTMTLEMRFRDRYAFWEPRVNQGRNGWYLSGGAWLYGAICHPNGDLVSEDVLLDTGGTPIDSSLKVRGGTIDAPTIEDPADAPPEMAPQQNIDFVFLFPVPGNAEIMLWKRYPEKDLTPLFTAMGING